MRLSKMGLERKKIEADLMPTLNWSHCAAVESIPGKVSGAWLFKDTRMPVATVFENRSASSPEVWKRHRNLFEFR